MLSDRVDLPSAAVFAPQSKEPKTEYLSPLREYLLKNSELSTFVQVIRELPDLWPLYSDHNPDLKALRHGLQGLQALSDWIETGSVNWIFKSTFGIVTLPLLTIIQIGQYFQFLQELRIKHGDLIRAVQSGAGIQGCCSGLITAIAVASSADEKELAQNACKALRVAVGVGAYSDLGVAGGPDAYALMVVRLKDEGQETQILEEFPVLHISAITDLKTITFSGPAVTIAALKSYAIGHGLYTQSLHLGSKVHSTENGEIAKKLSSLCINNDHLCLPEASSLKVDLRSNKTGKIITKGSLTNEVIDNILTSQCRWHDVMTAVCETLQQTGQKSHQIASFGLVDCVPLATFNYAGMQITRTNTLPATQDSSLTPLKVPNDNPYHLDAVAIVGMACRLPGADTTEELWDIMSEGQSMAQEVPKERIDIHSGFRASQDAKWANKQKFYGNFMRDVDAFDNAFFKMNPRECLAMDPQQRLLLETAYQAMESSGYLRTHRRESGDKIGVYVGASFVDYIEQTSSHPPTAYTSTGTIRAFLCGKISYYFGWSGPSEVIDTACSSSLVAIRRAVKAVQMNECSMALAGGVNLMTTATNFMDLGKAGFLSPTGQCKPFDGIADGYCRAEGVGLVVLKRLSQARADGDNILGVISGAQTNQGGLSAALTIPSSPSQVELYDDIVRQAGISPHQVSYVEAHGTGTQAGDPLEIASIRQVFGGKQRHNLLHVGSIKASIGHCETAAGVAGVIKAVLMLQKERLPPLANFKSLNPKIPSLQPDQMAISSRLQNWDVSFRAICVNSYGAAGSNAAVLLCQAPQTEGPQSGAQKNLTFPITIRAASKASLLMYADALAMQLGKAQSNIGDVAFSLDRRNKDHKFLWTSTHSTTDSLARSIRSGIDVVQAPQTVKKVVLAFSGQTRQTVGLDQGLYNACHLLRSYIDQVNREVVRLGFSSLLPAIFDKELICDEVTLQCGIFAVQYSCAKSWIDSGLKVDAVVGHSFGELTALAVSDVLTLKGAVRIISARAALMKTKWGPERGTMLVIHRTAEDVHDILSKLPSGDRDLEIACYNAHSSQVVVGSDASITKLENFLKNETTYNRTIFQRLNVSHGFHSQFTEDILSDLDQVANSVDFHPPKLYLESCTSRALSQVTPSRISRHTREPVFFHQAIQRIEQQFGSCVWLEAGMDSPIISMIKRSVATSENHVFQTLGSISGEDFMLPLSRATSTLCQEGIPVSHWSFVLPQKNGIKQVWLPPYQFEKTRHWLPYVDRTMEAIQTRPVVEVTSEKKTEQVEVPRRLVNLTDSAGKFKINTTCRTYVGLVSGHSVLRHPLCPASMYMECATMAAQIVSGDIGDKALWFKDISIEAPLGVDSNREVSLTLSPNANGSPQEWSFLVNSTLKNDPRSKVFMHGKGRFSFMDSYNASVGPQAQHYQKLVVDRIKMIATNPTAETLKKQRAYGLFSRIVNYGAALKGITSITLLDFEAIAELDIPPIGSEPNESTVTQICDTVILDNFIQVAGLLINSGNECSEDDAYLAIGVDSIFISSACGFADSRSWTVYAMFTPLGGGRANADVFVLNKAGALITTINGVRFAKLPLKKLHKLLESANQSSSQSEAKEKPRKSIPESPETSSGPSTAQMTPTESIEEDDDNNNVEERLRELIGEFVELPSGPIPDNANIGDLGVDSLGASELLENLQSTFGIDIEMDDLSNSTYGKLRQLVGACRTPAQPTKQVPTQQAGTSGMGFAPATSKPKQDNSQKTKQLMAIIAEHSGTDASTISNDANLEDLGVDSLSLIELKSDLEDLLGVELDDDFSTDATVASLLAHLGRDSSPPEVPELPKAATPAPRAGPVQESSSAKSVSPADSSGQDDVAVFSDPITALMQCGESFDTFAQRRGFVDYFKNVTPSQDELMLAYIAEAFQTLGVDMWRLHSGDVVPDVQFLPRHSKLMHRLWAILERLEIITRKDSLRIRTSIAISTTPSSTLLDRILPRFPKYTGENKLMAVSGSKLADCLIGKADAVRILFGSTSSQALLNDYYGDSPQLSVATDVLVDLMDRVLTSDKRGVVKILETGGGFGGTTARFARLLDGLGRRIQYTFTDMSPKLVKAASQKFSMYKWMDFQPLDLEKEPAASLQGKYDIVLGTNVVHATADVAQSCRRIRSLLRAGGFMVLSEVTKIIDWYDLVFGLLDGWWLATDGREYPLQPPDVWIGYLKAAGFQCCSYSGGTTEEEQAQRIIVGSTVQDQRPSVDPNALVRPKATYNLETVTYKTVDGLNIEADIYYPKEIPSKPMPIALMMHGGSFMTFSKNIVRPWQIPLLLENGILPVSIDYRLCPEVTLHEGPMSDARDAVVWSRNELPRIARGRGFAVNPEKIAAIGWSTGGTLAMSTAWTTEQVGVQPPQAILNFYGPSDFNNQFWYKPRAKGYPPSTMTNQEIARHLYSKPIVQYDIPTKDFRFGGLHPADPRSQLVFNTFNSLHAVSIFVDGFRADGQYHEPSPERIDAVSALSQVRNGNYRTPTFSVHGEDDEIVPIGMSVDFNRALSATGVKSELLSIPNKGHIFDLFLKPGKDEWDSMVVPGYNFVFDVLFGR